MTDEARTRNNPFPGPQPYRATDRDHFYGRDAVADELTSMILAHRSVALFGPSGAGKSSVMQAAVLPFLDEEHDFRIIAIDGWPAFETPVAWLIEVLLRGLKLTPPNEDLDVYDSVEWIVEQAFYRSDRPILIVLDQVEQLLFVQRDAAAVAEFLDWLDLFAGQPRRGLHLVLAMREDYLGRFRDRARGRHRLLENGFRLGPLTVGEITRAVIQAAGGGEPPQTWPRKTTRALMMQVRVAGQSERDDAEVQTAFAQIVCRALFAQRAFYGDAREASADAEIEAEPILQRYLEDALAALGPLRAPAEHLLEDHLVAIDGTRTLLTEDAARASKIASARELNKILTDLERAAILRAEQHRGTRYFELGHDWLAKRVFDRKQERRARAEREASERAREQQQRAAEQALERAIAKTKRARKITVVVTTFGLIAAGLGVYAWQQRSEAITARGESDRRRGEAEAARKIAEAAKATAETAQETAENAQRAAEQSKTRAEKSEKENERSVRQVFEVALRPLTDSLVKQKQSAGVVELDPRWTPLLARGEQTVVAASLGESFRAVVAGHEAALVGASPNDRSLFLEITIPWLLADQARRTIAIVSERPRDALQRSLRRLGYEVALLESVKTDDLLADVGALILDNRAATPFSAEERAVLSRFIKSGGGVLAVGHGKTWLKSQPNNTALDDYPMNTALAALGARWSDEELSPKRLAEYEIPAIVRFENTLEVDVDLFLGGADQEKYYSTLAGGEAREILTSVRSRWTFQTSSTDKKHLGVVTIEDEDQTVRISETVAKTRNKPKPRSKSTGDVKAPETKPTTQLRAKLTSEDMKAGLLAAKQSAKRCGTQLKTLMSDLTVKVKVGENGAVTSAIVLPPAKGTPEATCVAKEVSKLKFPRSKTGGAATWRLRLY